MAQDYGTPVPPPIGEVPPVQPPVQPKKSNRTIWIVVAIIAVLLCCCVIVAIVLLYQYGDQILNSINGTLVGPLSMLGQVLHV